MKCSILQGDCREVLKTIQDDSIQCCVTSPPYWNLRRYDGGAAEIGQEATPKQYIAALMEVFSQVHRVLKPDGTLWIVIGDIYARTGGQDGGGNREQLHTSSGQPKP